MLDGLAFLPVDDVQAGMAHLRTLVLNGADPLAYYFVATYVTGPTGKLVGTFDGKAIRMRRAPPSSLQLHGKCTKSLDGGRRANDVCEGWNNKCVDLVRHLVGHQHTFVWKCIKAFQADHEATDTLL